MPTLHRESGLPYGVWKRSVAEEAKRSAADSRKRKVDSDSNPSSSSSAPQKRKSLSTAATPSSSNTKSSTPSPSPHDKRIILGFLAYAPEEAVRTLFAKTVSAASPEELETHRKIFEPLLDRHHKPLHCVRCHESYLELENGPDSCKIPHDEPEYIGDNRTEEDLLDYEERGDGDSSLMRYPCCEGRVWDDDPDDGSEWPCVEEWHTIYPQMVDYFGESKDVAKKKQKATAGYSLDYRRRRNNKNTNVITCREKKCFSA